MQTISESHSVGILAVFIHFPHTWAKLWVDKMLEIILYYFSTFTLFHVMNVFAICATWYYLVDL
jgi:hypothetical protein